MNLETLLAPFVGPIGSAAAAFPFVALAILLPFAALHYRRFGRIHPWRAIAVYAFAFYLVTALFLVILPLPERPSSGAELAAWEERFGQLRTPVLDPTTFIRDIFKADPGVQRLRAAFQAVFNLMLLMPFGFGLAWLYKRRLVEVLGLGLALSLFFEVTQLTGVYWIWPGPFRLFDTGDLLVNTAGCVLGALPAIRLARAGILPDLNSLEAPASTRIGVIRRSLAFSIDLLAFGFVSAASILLLGLGPLDKTGLRNWGPLAAGFFFFIVLPAVDGGRGLGKRTMLCALRRKDGSPASWRRILLRQVTLWGLPPIVYVFEVLLPRLVISNVLVLLLLGWLLLWCLNMMAALFRKDRESPVDRYLGLRVTNTWEPRPPK